MHDVWPTISRELILLPLFFLPRKKRIDIDRWLRGREENRKLQLADYVLMSWGKSGRTWLRVMMSRFYQGKFGIPAKQMLGFDNYHRMNAAVPRIFFTHGNYLRNYTGDWETKVDFYGKKIIMLVRDPRDVAVSQFFQWQYRMKPNKKILNKYPSEGDEVSMFDFIMDPDAGLPKIIDFMNLWAGERERMKGFFLLRYEDLRTRAEETLRALLEFMDTPGTDAEIREAIEFSSYENMKKMEQKKTFWLSGGRMVPKDRDNPNTYKVRRAKVGGYRDYFDDDQVARIEALVNSTLSPYYGYNSPAAEPEPEATTPQEAQTGNS